MVSRDYIIEKLKSLPEESLEEIADFIEFVGAKKKRKPETISESMRVFKNVVRGFSPV